MRFGLWLLLLVGAIGAYVSQGLVQIEPDQQAVVLLLGRPVRTLDPGLHVYLPVIERLERRRVTVTREEEFGYRTISSGPPPEYEDRPEEKAMLTRDANLVDVEFVVQYRIASLSDYLFNTKEVPATIRDVAQAALREVVANSDIDDVLTQVKGPIEDAARVRIQEVLDSYGAGVTIQGVRLQDVKPPEKVRQAFADVASAEQDKERLILEAQGYADQVVPLARGEAQSVLNQAQAYRESRTLASRGEAKRFSALLVEYRRAPRVTRERLYLETLEAILPKMEKVIVDEGQMERVLPYLPLGRRGPVQ